MKKIIALLLSLALILSMMAGCTDDTGNNTASTGAMDTSGTTQTTQPTQTTTEPDDPWASYECITIAEALELCEQYVDAPSETWYYIRATVVSIDSETYGQMTISDETGSIMVYGTRSADGSERYDAMTNKPVAGDDVLLYGCLQNYKGNTKEVQTGWIIDFIANNAEPVVPELPEADTTITVADALAMPLTSGNVTEGRYYITATVDSITNAAYGAMVISDGTGSISVYGSYSADGSIGYAEMTDKPYKGDTVTLYCTIQNFNGTMEIKNARIISVEHADIAIDGSYENMSIADVRAVSEGTKVQVSGVVAQITYANGMIPSGVILVDDTSSIYVYDGDLAARVSVGNTITIAASKTYWILETEQSNAAKFGYKGCNQLESAQLISCDSATTDYNKSWIEETTVKQIMDTPVTTDITSKIFKVTAVVHKVDGSGFTNYYIDDLDDKTGSYSYTQCNGSDFAWLDEFDGKICTVYLVALNAKSTASDCYWRFLPITVIYEDFNTATVNAAEFAVQYYGVGQFQTSYTGNPALELITSVDSELLGFSGIKLSYSSSDTSVISIDGNVMNCLKSGTATIKVTGSYNGKTYSEKVKITVNIPVQEVSYPTVSDAISAADGDTVTVKGIVGPSLVNQSGFYLIDDTGVIAVLMDEATLQTIEVGHEIIIEAERYHKTKGGTDYFGQTCLQNATVLINNYGSHDYCDDFFVTGTTVADFYALDPTVDYSTTVYVLTGTVSTGSYGAVYFTGSDGTYITLYASGSGQYSWLLAYEGQEITVEVAPCNWNSKTYWRGCVLAVVHEDGTKTVNTLNFN